MWFKKINESIARLFESVDEKDLANLKRFQKNDKVRTIDKNQLYQPLRDLIDDGYKDIFSVLGRKGLKIEYGAVNGNGLRFDVTVNNTATRRSYSVMNCYDITIMDEDSNKGRIVSLAPFHLNGTAALGSEGSLPANYGNYLNWTVCINYALQSIVKQLPAEAFKKLHSLK